MTPFRVLVYSVPDSPWMAYLREKLPEVEPIWDTTRNSVDTFCALLTAAGADPVLALEDDIILTTDFLAKVTAVQQQVRSHVVQFFSLRAADVVRGSRWDQQYSMNQCTYFPAGYAAAVRTFAPVWRATRPRTERGGSDLLVRAWLRSVRQPYWLSVPSLVQHRNARSRIGPRSTHRQSPTFVDPDF